MSNQDNQTFLETISNRAGLDTIDYRIGQYSDFRNLLFKKLNHDQTLAKWTHREPDDPGIALLEGASILGDVLSFYQDLYANEAYLKTAKWRESVAELVRLTGYRLSPGVAGLASFAFELDSEKEVIIPKSFPVKIQLEDMDEVAEFETKESLTAYPALSKFNLYRQLEDKNIIKETKEFYIDKVAGQMDDLELEEGDRLIFGIIASDYAEGEKINFSEIVEVESVRILHDKQIIKIKGALQSLNNKSIATGYKLGRTFNHCGHTSPPTKVSIDSNGDPKEESVSYYRYCNRTTTGSVTPSLAKEEFPLDQVVENLTAGTKIICQQKFGHYYYGCYVPHGDSSAYTRYYIRTIAAIGKRSITWGSVTAGSTLLTLDKKVSNSADNSSGHAYYRSMDIREMQFHEVISEQLTLKAVPENTGDTKSDTVIYYGNEKDVNQLNNRVLFLKTEEDEQLTVSVSSVEADTSNYSLHTKGWKVKLTSEVDLEDFEHIEEPFYSVYGNIVSATQGRSMKEIALGNGDARQTFQTFKIPKAPLTYQLDGSATPPEVPEINVTVDGEVWTWVPSLFNYGSKDKVYITREDEDGNSYVQFGDGKTGAKVTSGVKNVKAVYRKGVAACGEKQEGAKAQTASSLDGLDKVHLAGTVSMGVEAEEGDNAREAAPGKLQSLGRLVSIKDYEHEVLSMSGVAKVKAAWTLEQHIPLLKMWVVMENGEYDKLSDIRSLIDTYNKERGLNRHPVKIEQGLFQYVRIHAIATVPSGVNQDDIEEQIKIALGVTGEEENGLDGREGLFGIKNRSFGQDAYANNVLATVQNVDNIIRVELKSFHTMIYWPIWPDNDNWIDEVTYIQDVITAPERDVLALYKDHLKIQFIEAINEEDLTNG